MSSMLRITTGRLYVHLFDTARDDEATLRSTFIGPFIAIDLSC